LRKRNYQQVVRKGQARTKQVVGKGASAARPRRFLAVRGL